MVAHSTAKWSAMGIGVKDRVWTLAMSGSDLYAGGSFTMAGGTISACVANAVITPPVPTLDHHGSGTNTIRFSGVRGTAYHLRRATNMAGLWPNIATKNAPANGRIEAGDDSAPPGQAFYRVIQPGSVGGGCPKCGVSGLLTRVRARE